MCKQPFRHLAASVGLGSQPPLPQKFAMTALKTKMSAETRNDLKDHEFPKKANGRIGDGSTERHAAQALGSSEPSLTDAAVCTNVRYHER